MEKQTKVTTKKEREIEEQKKKKEREIRKNKENRATGIINLLKWSIGGGKIK